MREILTVVFLVALGVVLGCGPAPSIGSGDRDSDEAVLQPNETDSRWVSQHQPRAEIALVFVHGLFGDTLNTWSGQNAGFFDLIAMDPMIEPKVDIFAFGFTSNMYKSGSLSIDEAATSLRMRLENEGVLSYRAVVFVCHSMGGLVVLHLLVNESELLERVPAIVLYATPQEGADLTRIARHLFKNDSIDEMRPGAENAFLRTLNNGWKRLDRAARPVVHCAYEKEETSGVMIVEWGTATRFCSGAALAVTANHLGIVKPDRIGHDSFMLLQNALRPILAQDFLPRLEMPDFEFEGDTAVVSIKDPRGRQDVRLVNPGALPLEYALRDWPDGLLVWPLPGEHILGARATARLQLAPAFGATESEYQFTLEWEASGRKQRSVLVRIPDLERMRIEEAATRGEVIRVLRETLAEPEFVAAIGGGSTEEGRERFIEVVRQVIEERYPALGDSGQWVRTAEVLQSLSWPRFAVAALRRAEAVDPAISGIPSVRLLGERSASLAGSSALSAVPAVPFELTQFKSIKVPAFDDASSLQDARVVAEAMVSIPAVGAEGLSLQGDLAVLRGDSERAMTKYRQAEAQSTAPIHQLQVERIIGGPGRGGG